MNDREIAAISRRPLRYWNEDGLADVVSGVTFLAFGGLSWGMYVEKPLVVAALTPVLILVGFFGPNVLKKAKERLVFPRTGAVALRGANDPPKWAVTLVLSVLVLLLAMVIPFDRDAFDRRLPIVMGVIFTAGTVVAWRRLGLLRYLLVAAVTAVTTAVLLVRGPSDTRGYITIMLVTGAAMVVTGTFAFVTYLRSAPLAHHE